MSEAKAAQALGAEVAILNAAGRNGQSRRTPEENTVPGQRGPVARAGDRLCVGRVGAPPQMEATSERFYFWIPPDALVEKTQIVTCESEVAEQKYRYYALVEEVHRCSRKRSMGHEVDEADNDLDYQPPFESEGFTYASASILSVEPMALTPPRERSEVLLANEADVEQAYGFNEIAPNSRLAVGLVKNGGSRISGPGYIDTDYLLGTNGGHMNVNGAAGRGTKSSFLLFMNWLLLAEAKRQMEDMGTSSNKRLRVVPIILNVKNYDLFYIDKRSTRYKPEEHEADWDALGFPDPQPFADATFYAAQQVAGNVPVPTGRTGEVKPYSWSLNDIVAGDLFPYLFADDDYNDNFSALILDIQEWLTSETQNNDGSVTLRLRPERPQTFQGLLDWVRDQASLEEKGRELHSHATGTWKKLSRRLLKLVYESRGVLRRNDANGNPLKVVQADTCPPLVVDLAAMAGESSLQRFVVAAIFKQIVEARTGSNAQRGLVYLVTLDELNRFAPKGAKDAITQLIEKVATEMRSQGVILLGAQQQASKVSDKIIENAGIRVVGKTGALELAATTWHSLSDSARRKADRLPPNEKLVLQDNFREPMHIRVPFPIWAMNPNEAQNDMEVSDSAPASINRLLQKK